jgi:hypothetical protein
MLIRAGLIVGGVVGSLFGVLVVLSRYRRPEPTWEPGLEFNPDFDLTPEEILSDIRGESPSI